MKRFRDILILLLVVAVTMGCDATIHEYPDTSIQRITVPVTLNLEFEGEMPLYKEVPITKKNKNADTRSGLTNEAYDLRYIVNVYEVTAWRQTSEELVSQHIVTKDEGEWDHTVTIDVGVGEYRFVVWADYVDAGTNTDKYYNTSNFSFISLIGDISGSNDFRDTFVGDFTTNIALAEAPHVYTVPMERPMAKYRFVSNDLDAFISRMLALKKQRLEANRSEEDGDSENRSEENRGEDDDTKTDTKVEVDLADYYVVFNYPNFVTVNYDALSHTVSPRNGLSFTSNINKISDTEAEIGFDYVFVALAGDMRESVTQVQVSLEIFEKNGEKVGGVNKLDIDIARGKLTEVRGSFLTLEEDGGIGIVPDFDGEFTVPVD